MDNEEPVPPILKAAVKEFRDWSDADLSNADARDTVTAPLYHYTNAAGLEGIIKSQQIWFTSYTHLNDPSELEYGMSIALALLNTIGEISNNIIKLFCMMVSDNFTPKEFGSVFGFFFASFSRDRDDLGQWRAYGDNGRGFSLGLAPCVFAVEDKVGRLPHEHIFLGHVVYGKEDAREHFRPAIEKSIHIVRETMELAPDLMQNCSVGLPFLLEMAKELMKSMTFNCLLTKHEAYKHENEVRLIIFGELSNLAPHVSTRPRGGDIVPFIKSDTMPIQDSDSIAEIVIGPAAADTAEYGVCTLLKPFHDTPDSIVHRSAIPYRAH